MFYVAAIQTSTTIGTVRKHDHCCCLTKAHASSSLKVLISIIECLKWVLLYLISIVTDHIPAKDQDLLKVLLFLLCFKVF